MTQITFGANYIQNVMIQKRTPENKFEPCEVAVVELDANSMDDFNTLRTLASSWGPDTFVPDMTFHFRVYAGLEQQALLHLFAITQQKKDFEKLNTNDVMGLADFKEEKNLYALNYLQTNPDYGYVNYFQEYKHVGTAMLNFLKAKFSDKPIKLHSTQNAVPFYLKNGFQQQVEHDGMIYLNA